MSNAGLTAIRPNEDLVLCNETKTRISGRIVQYLSTHQINGIRFIYKNYRKVNIYKLYFHLSDICKFIVFFFDVAKTIDFK